jgi:hypothetical protein
MLTKLRAIRMPDTANVHCLYLESITNHGMRESVDATDAPNPTSTRSDGRAQQRRVPTDVNSEK